MRSPRAAWARLLVGGLLGLAFVLTSPAALAHDDEEHEEEPTPTVEPAVPPEAEEVEPEAPVVELRLPDEVEIGRGFEISAVLTDPHDGSPIRAATVVFTVPAFWGEEYAGPMVIGAATTDRRGVATIRTQLRTEGELEVTATFAGGGMFLPAEASMPLHVTGAGQLYAPSVGIRVPWLNLWVLAAVIALVWGLYLVAGSRLLAIARAGRDGPSVGVDGSPESRRSFLRRALPFGALATMASLGGSLIAVVLRSPRTHGNLLPATARSRYSRTPIAHVGAVAEMRPMPPVLDREVSFTREVLPIFLRHGGPHVVRPKHSPPPGGLLLDTYEHVMAKEGVIVPGKPEESHLVMHLLSPAIQMPPSVPPLPDEEVQVIVTWIAQGARDN